MHYRWLHPAALASCLRLSGMSVTGVTVKASYNLPKITERSGTAWLERSIAILESLMKHVQIGIVITFAVKAMAPLFEMAFEPVTVVPLEVRAAENINEV